MGHVIGIGTLWDNNNLITGDLVYTGENAKRVWTQDWDCVDDSPPIEKDGGPGTRGGHWDETCLVNEFMTGYINGNGQGNPISTLTIASLQDIGYGVDYGAADAYDGSDTTCCFGGGASVQDDTDSLPSLSEEGRAIAIAYGKQVLNENALSVSDGDDIGISEELEYAADKVVSILFEEGGQIFEVVVQSDAQ